MTVYRGRKAPFELVAVLLTEAMQEVDVFDTGVLFNIPPGRGMALFLTHVEAAKFAGCLVEQEDAAQDMAKRLVYSIERELHGPVVMSRAQTGDAIASYAQFSDQMAAGRERLTGWLATVAPLVEDAIAVCGAAEGG